jgi:hypothetical protein
MKKTKTKKTKSDLTPDRTWTMVVRLTNQQHLALRSMRQNSGVPIQFIVARAIEKYLARRAVKEILQRRGLP